MTPGRARCHLRRPPASRDLRHDIPGASPGTPTTGGLWLRPHTRTGAPADATKSTTVRPDREDAVRTPSECSHEERGPPASVAHRDPRAGRLPGPRRGRTTPTASGRPASTCSTPTSRAGSAAATSILLGGPQGMGKTTWMLQVARNVARQGRPVLYFCYEHDQTTMLIRLVALEAGLIGGHRRPEHQPDPVHLRVRRRPRPQPLPAARGHQRRRRGARDRPGVLRPAHIHRSSGTQTTLDADQGDHRRRQARSTARRRSSASTTCRRSRCRAIAEDERITAGHRAAQGHDARLRRAGALRSSPPTRRASRPASGCGSTTCAARPRSPTRPTPCSCSTTSTTSSPATTSSTTPATSSASATGRSSRSRRTAAALTGVDMEFPKRFEQSRFETQGQLVREKLVDERVFTQSRAVTRAGASRHWCR